MLTKISTGTLASTQAVAKANDNAPIASDGLASVWSRATITSASAARMTAAMLASLRIGFSYPYQYYSTKRTKTLEPNERFQGFL
jgi:hypothetical protein